MADVIMRFTKSLGIFEVRCDTYLGLLAEFMTERPHPWFVTCDREGSITHHLGLASKNLVELGQETSANWPFLQIEAAYHACAAILTRYDEYTGCKETSPIVILYHSLRRMN